MKKLLAILLTLALLLSMAACTPAKSNDIPTETDEATPETSEQETETREPETEVETTSEPETEAIESSCSAPLLYQVTSENGGVVWLFGSVHVGIDAMYPLPDYVLDAYGEADSLAVECDIVAAQEDMELMMSLLQPMIYTDGTTISDHLSPELYEAAVEIMKENNSYLPMLDYYMPIMWVSFIESFTYADFGYDSEAGIDLFLLNLAKAGEKEILEVESVPFQYNLLASFSPELQAVLLENSVDSYGSEEAKAHLDTLLTAWCEGGAAAILALLNEESTEPITEDIQLLMDEYNTAMLVDRNIAMTDYAEAILQNGDKVFICVGMAHILGEGAMVDLLRQRGYTVEAVS